MRTQSRSCLVKFRHNSKAEAKGVRSRMEADGIVVPGELHVYKCPFCLGGWHLGHRPGWRRDRVKLSAAPTRR